MKQIQISDILTDEEAKRAIALYQSAAPGTFAKRAAEEIIKPVIGRINAKVGQENNPMYLAYAVEYAMMRASK